MVTAISATWAEFFELIHETEANAASEDFLREHPMNVMGTANGVFAETMVQSCQYIYHCHR